MLSINIVTGALIAPIATLAAQRRVWVPVLAGFAQAVAAIKHNVPVKIVVSQRVRIETLL